MKPIRIGLITYAMHCGGVETFLLRLGRYLAQQGMDVEIVTCEARGEWFQRITEAGLKGVDLADHSACTPLVRAIETGRRLAGRNYDVVLLNHARDAQASLAMLPDTTVAIPIVHNDLEEVYRIGCANPLAWNVAVAVSPQLRAEVQRRVPERPVVMILHGVELPSETKWQRRASWGEPLRLVFVGRLVDSHKGVLLLPEILHRCLELQMKLQLTIVGDGPDKEKLEQRILNLGVQDRTKLLGTVPPGERIYDILLGAHILLMTSWYEGLPIVLLEAQACGCVPVASRLPGITDTAVLDGVTGLLVDRGDIEGFVRGISKIYANAEEWNRMSKEGHARIEREFSIEVMGRAYVRLIEDCLTGRYPLPRSRRQQLPLELGLFSWREFAPKWAKRAWRWLWS